MTKYNFYFFILVLAFFLQAPCLHAWPQKYHITASNTHEFVWFRIAKVGTRTIYKILNDNRVKFSINDSFVPFRPANFRDYFKFVFVRNPWDRVVSCYFNKVVNQRCQTFASCLDRDFDYFVDYINKQDLKDADRHIQLQTALFPFHRVDFIGRLETFEQDLKIVLKRLGLPAVEIPKKNASRHKHYSHYYNERTKQIIAHKYRADIEAFGYKFETR